MIIRIYIFLFLLKLGLSIELLYSATGIKVYFND